MKKNVIISLIFLAGILLTGTAEAGNVIDTSDVNVMAYYNVGSEIDLSQAIQEFDFITESTGQYVEGKLRIWYDDPDGRNPGNIQDFERRDNADTDILFASNVSIRVKSDGWIVAWLNNDQNLSDIVFWNDTNTGTLPSDTTLGQAIWRITDRVGTNYNKTEVKYYSYKYPLADRLLIGGRVTTNGGETYNFIMPSATTVYDAYLHWTIYLLDNDGNHNDYVFGKVKMNTTDLYYKTTNPDYYFYGMFEYSRYYLDITDYPKDAGHTIYINSGNTNNGQSILKSAVAILYKSG